MNNTQAEYCPDCDMRQIPGMEDHMPKCGIGRPKFTKHVKRGCADQIWGYLLKHGKGTAADFRKAFKLKPFEVSNGLRTLRARGVVKNAGVGIWERKEGA